ncbi:PREDICTED: uncharacterized protein LOC109240732 [Nicotiana attenuata]|uniref:uncharacterized protein LOC109240732 n=1 Tax=Nicotiana attenuata TaxID=49451 RepID=UPI0009057352|nr:PREDICTED: uncharacterized protein LOC109240732 [Nicotiana attenuata]
MIQGKEYIGDWSYYSQSDRSDRYSACKRFLWIGGVEVSKKELIAWDKLYIPKVTGGLNIIVIQAWNKAAICKLLWNICTKKDKLWVKWIHCYYGKRTTLWMNQPKYKKIREEYPKCSRRRLICNNNGAPRWVFILYLNLQGKLRTRDRIAKWSQIEDMTCPLCASGPETADHLFFECAATSQVWEMILKLRRIIRRAQGWSEEVLWAEVYANGHSAMSNVYRLRMSASVYHIRTERNLRYSKEKPGK